jgi:hypothetical protein
MATIKIYDSSDPINSIEFFNAGESEDNQMLLQIDHNSFNKEYLMFSISKEDARELILYLKKQFVINP